MSLTSAPLSGRLRRPGLPVETVVIVIGCVVLLGWLLDVGMFKSVAPGLPSMKPNAAVAAILSGVGLWVLRLTPRTGARVLVGRACGASVVLIGSLTLGEYLFGWQLGIDQLLFDEVHGAVGTSAPGRMGANAAVVFVLDGLALLVLGVELRRFHPAQVLALISGVIALVAFCGYLFGSYGLAGFGSATRISIYAAVAYLAMSVAILLARPGAGLMALATSAGAGGVTIRRLLVPSLVTPLVIGWLLYRGERGGLYAHDQTFALLVVAVSVFFLSLTWMTARLLDRSDVERRQAEDGVRALSVKLEARVDQLKAANAELEAFSYSVSHDLRAPLRAIDGFSRLLLDEFAGELSPEARRYLGLVGRNTQNMGTLIDGLLSFSKLGQQRLNKRSVDVDALAREVVAELMEGGSVGAAEISIGVLPRAHADPILLRQVLANLLSNALKYTRHVELPNIEIGSYARDGTHVYFVRDNGVGFDMRHAGKLFEVFQRLHRAEDYEGTGLGLALVARIAKRHGGRTWAEARPGKGATFHWTLN